MPKRPVEMIPINKEMFLDILKKKHISIRKLGAESPVCDKTIRRALNAGKIKEKTALQLAAYLNVDPKRFGSYGIGNYYSKDELKASVENLKKQIKELQTQVDNIQDSIDAALFIF